MPPSSPWQGKSEFKKRTPANISCTAHVYTDRETITSLANFEPERCWVENAMHKTCVVITTGGAGLNVAGGHKETVPLAKVTLNSPESAFLTMGTGLEKSDMSTWLQKTGS